MQMPEMDGQMIARAIKEDPAIASTRLVLLTSLGRRGYGREARRAGIAAYLTKPVRQSEFYDALATVMGPQEKKASEHETPLITRRSLEEKKASSRAHVLVAEDNAVNQRVAVRMLEKLGYRADVAANGLKAIEALSSPNPYAVVLMDVQMPQMDGYEVTAEIRKREKKVEGRHTPIIAMTANAMQGDRQKALEAGMDDYISKPVKTEDLGAVLNRWISLETQPDALVGEADDGSTAPQGYPLDLLEGPRDLQ